MRDAERASLKRDALHFLEKLVGFHLGIDDKRLDRNLQEAGALLHAGDCNLQRRRRCDIGHNRTRCLRLRTATGALTLPKACARTWKVRRWLPFSWASRRV